MYNDCVNRTVKIMFCGMYLGFFVFCVPIPLVTILPFVLRKTQPQNFMSFVCPRKIFCLYVYVLEIGIMKMFESVLIRMQYYKCRYVCVDCVCVCVYVLLVALIPTGLIINFMVLCR